jgi:hypothetical protein
MCLVLSLLPAFERKETWLVGCQSSEYTTASKAEAEESRKLLRGSMSSSPSCLAGASLRLREPVRKQFCISMTRKAVATGLIKEPIQFM